MYYMHDIGWEWWVVMSIGMIAFWGLVVYAIVWLVRSEASQPREQRPRERPDEVLERRLAEGEISIDEYNRLRETIHGRPHEPQPV
jgi:putative membrane protein